MSLIQILQKGLDKIYALRQTSEVRYPNERRIPYTGRTQAGVFITPDRALMNDTVWACHKYVTESCGQLPAKVIRKLPNNRQEVITSHPVDSVLNWRVNPNMSPFQFRETMVGWAIIHGNAVAEIERNGFGSVVNLWPIDPHRVSFFRNVDTGELIYRINQGVGTNTVELNPNDVFHLRAFGNGDIGLSVVEYAAQAIGWAQATLLFGASFFGEGLNFGGTIISDAKLDKDTAQRIREELNQTFRGPERSNKWFIGDQGLKVTKTTATPDEAQFILTLQHQVESICFIPGTEIITDSGIKNIEDIRAGEKVLTHKGRWRQVNRTMCNDYIGTVVKVKAKSLESVTSTSEHPFYVQKVNCTREHNIFPVGDPEWIKAENLKPIRKYRNGDRARGEQQNLIMPMLERGLSEIDLKDYATDECVIENGNKIKVSSNGRALFINRIVLANRDLGWLCGLFAGDGSTNKGTVVIYTGWVEKEIIEKAKQLFKEVFNAEAIVTQTQSVARITINNKILASFFSQFGHESHLKSFPSWCLEQSPGFCRGLIEGLVDSDGFVHKGIVGLRTTSINLAWQTRLLVWSLGINASLQLQSQEAWRIGGRTGESRDIYTIKWFPNSNVRGSGGIGEGYIYLNLDSVEKLSYNGKVYNLEVEEDESYTTTGGVVHNCRFFAVPPHKVGHLLRMTFNNVEQLSIDAVGQCIVPWAMRLQEEATYKLFGGNRNNLEVVFDLKGLLRGAFKDRQEGLQIQRRNGVISSGDWARLEDMPEPKDGKDIYIVEKNMVTMDQLVNPIPKPPSSVTNNPNTNDPTPNQAALAALLESEIILGSVDA